MRSAFYWRENMAEARARAERGAGGKPAPGTRRSSDEVLAMIAEAQRMVNEEGRSTLDVAAFYDISRDHAAFLVRGGVR